jgi:hypothetical protein
MPLYEYRCPACSLRDEVFARTVNTDITPPNCSRPGCEFNGKPMVRAISTFARHLTMKDLLAEAEAKFGAEVDAAMGPEPDVGRYARRYEQLAKDLPPPDEP